MWVPGHVKPLSSKMPRPCDHGLRDTFRGSGNTDTVLHWPRHTQDVTVRSKGLQSLPLCCPHLLLAWLRARLLRSSPRIISPSTPEKECGTKMWCQPHSSILCGDGMQCGFKRSHLKLLPASLNLRQILHVATFLAQI